MLHSMRAAAVAALFGIVVAHPAAAGVTFNLNVNGMGSYSTDGGVTFVDDPGVLEADPSSGIGVPVLTFAFPLGFGNGPGDVSVKDVTSTGVLGLFRFTDSAGDISGTHNVDRIILYANTTTGSDPADTGLPPNAGSFFRTADANGLVLYTAGPNSYSVQFDVPEPASLAILGAATAGLGFARRKRAT